jgi:hypothetical protein
MAFSWTLDAAGGEANAHVVEPAWLVGFQEIACAAQPEIGLKVVPSFREISNSTVPVGATGLSDPGDEIVNPAVAVMVCPVTDGFTTTVTPVVVAARFTVWVTAGEVEPAKLASPE